MRISDIFSSAFFNVTLPTTTKHQDTVSPENNTNLEQEEPLLTSNSLGEPPLLQIDGDSIAQHGVIERIKRLDIFTHTHIEAITEYGNRVLVNFEQIKLPSFINEEQLKTYLLSCHWLATQFVNSNDYKLSVSIRGLGGGGGCSKCCESREEKEAKRKKEEKRLLLEQQKQIAWEKECREGRRQAQEARKWHYEERSKYYETPAGKIELEESSRKFREQMAAYAVQKEAEKQEYQRNQLLELQRQQLYQQEQHNRQAQYLAEQQLKVAKEQVKIAKEQAESAARTAAAATTIARRC